MAIPASHTAIQETVTTRLKMTAMTTVAAAAEEEGNNFYSNHVPSIVTAFLLLLLSSSLNASFKWQSRNKEAQVELEREIRRT